MFIDLLNNLAITAAVLFIGGKFFEKRTLDRNSSLRLRVYIGIGSAVLGILLMVSTIKVTETVIVDLRHLALVVAAIFGGPVAAILSGVIIGLMRILLYGINDASIIASIIAIVMGVVFGIISTLKYTRVLKYIMMNVVYVLVTSITLYVLLNNPDTSKLVLSLYIPISIVGAIFTCYLSQYIKKSNENHRSIMYYKLMADNTTDIITTHFLDGSYKYISPSCENVLGYKIRELTGRNPYDFIHSDNIAEIRRSHENLIDTSVEYSIEYRFQRKDGNYVWLETTCRKMNGEIGYSEEIICSTRNITERKLAEDAIRKSNNRYSNLLKYMPDPMIVLDQNNNILFANEQASLLGKYKINELKGMSINQFVHPEYQSYIDKQVKLFNESKRETVTMEFKIKTSLHQVLDIEATCKSISFKNQPAVQVIYRDITVRKKLEEEVRKTNERSQFITENSRDVISIISEDGTMNYISPACEKTFGYAPEELIGNNTFENIHPDDIGEILKLKEQAVNGNIDFAVLLYRYKRKDSEYIWLEAVARSVRTEGKLENILVISRDVTKRIEKEQTLEETNKKLQHLSLMDGLTQIPNRRFWDTTFTQEWIRHERSSIPLSIILMDVDYFKKYNDEYGHLKGDDCLIRVAKVLQDTLGRPNDFLARYGGEEFIAVLPETNESEAANIAEYLRMKIREEKLPHIKSEVDDYVTISLGCATLIPSEKFVQENLVNLADKALYSAKQAGRNCLSQV